jgi:signal transduction histidine kinase
MKRITSRFVLLIASAAIAPLVAYGVVSLIGLDRGTRSSVTDGNLRVAQQVASRIGQYVDHNTRVLKSIGLSLRGTNLQGWQQERVLRNYVLDFREFLEISYFAGSGRVLATSRLSGATLSVPAAEDVGPDGVFVAPVVLDEDGLPRTTLAVRVESDAHETSWIVGELRLEDLWLTINRIRVGQKGYALLVGRNQLIAHGNPDKIHLVARSAGEGSNAERSFAAQLLAKPSDAQVVGNTGNYTDDAGQYMLASAARVPTEVPWVVIVEQPESEALALANRLQSQLIIAIGLALLGTVILGWFWGRSFITRIFALTKATQAIADGRMDERVAISGKDEIRQLGDAFNSMADRLVQLQEDVRRQERQAMFGKIAAGLVHDLSHPIQTIVTNSKLIVRMFDDAEYRDTFKRMIERESLVIKRVLEDLRNIAQPIPLEHFPVDIDRSVGDVVESLKAPAETAGVNLKVELTSGGALVQGDVFALGRVYRNLLINAIQATAPGGTVGIATEATTDRVRIRVYDTGCGIAPDRIAAIFDDFVTTKRRGLGLGLAISKKIVEQLGGQISVSSEVGKGTTFVLEFPRAKARPIALAAG